VRPLPGCAVLEIRGARGFHRSPRIRPLLLSLVLGIYVAAPGSVLAGQAGVPGGYIETANRNRTQLYAHVLLNADSLFGAWSRAWSRGDSGTLASYYAEDIVVALPDGRVLEGEGEIAGGFADVLPEEGSAGLGRSDFDASGRLGYFSGVFDASVAGGEGRVGTVEGDHLTAVARYGEDWRIRAQLLAPEECRGVFLEAPTGEEAGHLARSRLPELLARRGFRGNYYRILYPWVRDAVWRLARGWQEGNREELTALYREEAVLRDPFGEEVVGGEAIADHVVEAFGDVETVQFQIVDLDASERLVYVYGTFFLGSLGTGGSESASGRSGPYALFFRLDDGLEVRSHFLMLPMAEEGSGESCTRE